MLILNLALRNLVRHYRRSLITLISISLGVAVVLWVQGVLEGQNRNIIDTVAKSQLGHIQIVKETYFKDRLLNQVLPPFDQSLLPSDALKVSRVYLPTIISSGDSSLTVQIIGVHAVEEAKATRIREQITEGEYLVSEPKAGCEDREILISRAASETLGVQIGDKIVLLGQNAQGSLANEMLRISGLFETGSRDFDRSIAYTSLNCAKFLLDFDGVHEVALLIKDSKDAQALKNQLQQKLGSEIKVATWEESMPRMNAIIRYNRAMGILIMVIFFVVLGLGIANTFLVSVFERTKEFGMMMAIGVLPRQVVGLVLLEVIGVTLSAALVGLALGFAVLLFHSHFGFDTRFLMGDSIQVGNFKIDPLIFPALEVGNFLRALGVLIIFSLIAAVYPAYKASKMNPMEALRS
jgi:putative ABC transport system permease protein